MNIQGFILEKSDQHENNPEELKLNPVHLMSPRPKPIQHQKNEHEQYPTRPGSNPVPVKSGYQIWFKTIPGTT